MALTNSAAVKEAGQLVYYLFQGLNSEADLTALIDRQIAIADAFVYRRVGAAVYGDTTPQIVTILAAAETYLTLAYTTTMLKARKVMGEHYPVDSEEGASYHDVLQPEWRDMAIELLDEFAVIDEPGQAVALPAFLISGDVDATRERSIPDDIRELLDEARGFPILEVPAVVR